MLATPINFAPTPGGHPFYIESSVRPIFADWKASFKPLKFLLEFVSSIIEQNRFKFDAESLIRADSVFNAAVSSRAD